jgi:hypothetical protein
MLNVSRPHFRHCVDRPLSLPQNLPVNGSLKTVLWRTAIAMAILAILLGAFYADQTGRGLSRWKQIEHEINARGVSVNWDDLARYTT